jgi:serine/threonine protein kinase
VARGLHYLHSHKTVHLDVKSSNVLLARDGTCKLADVGLARNLMTKNYLTHAGTLGTFAWSAPEVLTGQQCTTSADIYRWARTHACWAARRPHGGSGTTSASLARLCPSPAGLPPSPARLPACQGRVNSCL